MSVKVYLVGRPEFQPVVKIDTSLFVWNKNRPSVLATISIISKFIHITFNVTVYTCPANESCKFKLGE